MTLPLNQTSTVRADDLRFDSNNPRLAAQYGYARGASDEDVIMALKEAADLAELLLSIAANGYVDIEPMIVLGDQPPYLVLEGNRRLAAIKLLQNPQLAQNCRITLPEIGPEERASLETVTVYRVPDENAARAFIGFKHINGPHKWDSLAKAKYTAEWYLQEGVSVQEISRRIGDSFSTVKKMLYGWMALQQAKREGLFEITDRWPSRQFGFSHLYVALTRSQIRDYLGLDPSFATAEIVEDPIPQDRLDRFKQLLLWLYGSVADNLKPIIASQNPDVKNLAEIIDDDKARALLESKGDLAIAYASLTPDDVVFQKSLYQAEAAIKQAAANVFSYSGGDQLYDTALKLRQISTDLTHSMKIKRESSAQQD